MRPQDTVFSHHGCPNSWAHYMAPQGDRVPIPCGDCYTVRLTTEYLPYISDVQDQRCKHCRAKIRPYHFSTTGWTHINGIIVCAGQSAALSSPSAAEPEI